MVKVVVVVTVVVHGAPVNVVVEEGVVVVPWWSEWSKWSQRS
jgi:hypothetical protein